MTAGALGEFVEWFVFDYFSHDLLSFTILFLWQILYSLHFLLNYRIIIQNKLIQSLPMHIPCWFCRPHIIWSKKALFSFVRSACLKLWSGATLTCVISWLAQMQKFREGYFLKGGVLGHAHLRIGLNFLFSLAVSWMLKGLTACLIHLLFDVFLQNAVFNQIIPDSAHFQCLLLLLIYLFLGHSMTIKRPSANILYINKWYFKLLCSNIIRAFIRSHAYNLIIF